ncbi:larval cuticle protein A2B-like [Schistocerca americana]|uniref:larval cuticle protein A2B-like n=1 Tax=Schistocerca americana TaxID=7009 RepID=UPI001F4F45CB|nr:larval cuticle protein A2B-like [Schistocerca americana]XP_047108994.1 larval cuticle protein A2B-like [Schistocerca piceifrons]
MKSAVAVVLVVCAAAAAHAGLLHHAPPPPPQHEIIYDYVAPPQYRYDYAVRDGHTGDAKTQWESRDGDRVTGAYSLVDADGTTRIVEYTADDHNGFQAVVKRVGHPAPPPPQPPRLPAHPAPAPHPYPLPYHG